MNDSLQHDSTRPTRTALVLGGGGSTGNAWLVGVVAGLVEGGVDVTEADLLVGTSAGSTAAAQVTGAPPADALAITLTPPSTSSGGGDRGSGGRSRTGIRTVGYRQHGGNRCGHRRR